MMPELRWYQRDISQPLTSAVVLIVLCVTAWLVYARGMYGLWASLAYFGGIAFLVALYVTMRRQWPRLFRYLPTLWRRSY